MKTGKHITLSSLSSYLKLFFIFSLLLGHSFFFSVLANLPTNDDNGYTDENSTGGEDGDEDGGDGEDGANDDSEEEGEGEGEDEGDTGDPESCSASCDGDTGDCPSSIELKIQFGQNLNSTQLPQGYLRLHKEKPSANIVSPAGLLYVSNLNSEIIQTGTENLGAISIKRPNGYSVTYRLTSASANQNIRTVNSNRLEKAKPSGRQRNFSSSLQEIQKNGKSYYDRIFNNGSVARFSAETGKQVALFSPTGQQFTYDNKNIGIDIIKDSAGSLRQIYSSADGLADIVITDAYSYQIRLYPHSAITGKVNGLYQTNSEPHTVYSIGIHPEHLPVSGQTVVNYDRILISKTSSGNIYTYDWTFNDQTGQWSVVSGGNLRKRIKSERWNQNSNELIVEHKTFDPQLNDRLVFHKKEFVYKYPWGGMLHKTIYDPDGLALTDLIEFHEDASQVGSYSKYKARKYYTGKWETYTFNTDGRRNLLTRGFKNASYKSTSAVNESIENQYESHDPADVISEEDVRPRTVIRKIQNTVVEKTFYVYKIVNNSLIKITEKAASATAGYGDTGNMRTTRIYYPGNSGAATADRIKTIENANGIIENYTYEYGNYDPQSCSFVADSTGSAFRTIKTITTQNHPNGIAFKTTREVTVKDGHGDEVLIEKYIYTGSGYERIFWTAQVYNERHQVIKRLISNNQESDYTWGCCGLTSAKKENGTEILYTYDPLTRPATQIKKGYGNSPDLTTNYVYDAHNRVLELKKQAGNLSLTIQSEYDMLGRLLKVIDEQGRTTTYTYTPPTDNRGRITTKTLPGGFTLITEYYLDGKIKSITGTAQPAEYYDYGVDTSSNCYWTLVHWGSENSSRWKKTYQNMLGHDVKVEKSGYNGSIVTTENLYDQYGNKIKVDKTGEASRLYVYDELGTLIRSGLDVNGNGTLDLASNDRITDSSILYIQNNGSWWQESSTSVYGISNDAAATTIGITRKRLTGHAANVTQEQIQIDRYGNQTISQTVVDRNNKKVTQTVTYPDSVIPSERILENALLVSEKSKSGLLYSYSYDGLERKLSSTDPRTGTSTYSYYSSGMGKTGQLQSMTDPAGHVTTYDYEETTGRLKSVKNALNKYTYYSYNSYGQQIYQWGDSVYPVALEYDSLGQKIQQKTYRSGSLWSSPNWPSSENADVTTWSYDASSGLVTSKTDAQNHSVVYTYTSDGKLHTRTWARQAAGQALVTTYTYDDATGELLKADYSDGTPDIVRTYDRLGNLSSVSDAAGTRNFTYNSYFDLTGETLGNRTLSYTYATTGVKGRYTGLTGNHSYGYDAYGRLNQINNVSYSYTANSDLLGSVTRPNEVNSIWTYESHRDLVSSLENQHQTELRSRYAYVNDALGRRTSMSRSGSVFSQSETLSYSYNDRSEVTGATSDVNSAYSYVYSFDPIGNRLSASLAGTVYAYTTNSLNQYTAVNAVVPTYDADGNMLTNGAWSYTWNGENRLIKAENAASGMKLEFDYDYMGRRIYKKVYENNTLVKHLNFVYDGYKLIEEFDGLNGDALVRRYVWQSEDFGLDVPVSVYDAAGNKMYFYHTDANKNITELSDENGGIVAHYEYSPFGSLTASSGEYAGENPFRFSSEYSDVETGLVYYNYRYYSPGLGRWLSRDPVEEQGGWNLYNFIFNNPFSQFDALGAHGVVLFAKPVVPRVNPSTLPKLKPPTGVSPKPNLPRGNGIPLPKDGFKPPKNWNGQKVKCPNGKGSGYPDKKGNVWEPTDHKGTHPPHWDIQHPNGTHTPKYPTF